MTFPLSREERRPGLKEPLAGHGGIDRRYTPVAQREAERAALEEAIRKHPLAWILMTAKRAGRDKI